MQVAVKLIPSALSNYDLGFHLLPGWDILSYYYNLSASRCYNTHIIQCNCNIFPPTDYLSYFFVGRVHAGSRFLEILNRKRRQLDDVNEILIQVATNIALCPLTASIFLHALKSLQEPSSELNWMLY